MYQPALRAERLASSANGASVIDHHVWEMKPVLAGYDAHQILLDFYRVFIGRPAKSPRQATHVRIDDDPLDDAKSIAQHHVGGFASHTGQREEILHRAWYFTAVVGHDALGGGAYVLRLAVVKAG